MRRRDALVLACLLAVPPGALALPAAAQDAGQATGQDLPTDPLAAAVAAITGEYGQAQNDFYAKLEGIEDEAVISKMFEQSYPKIEPFVARVQAALAGHEAEPGAAAGLVWIAGEASDGAARQAALDALLAHHLAAPELARIVPGMAWGQAPEEEAFLTAVVRDAPGHDLQGQALFALAQRAARPRAAAGSPDAREAAARAEELFVRVGKDYGDVAVGERTLGDRADSWLYELHNLAIGKTAPEIEGTDVDGATFRLSDYRGKVVVLDFWGFW